MVISSWSGGKDSSLACFKAMQMGYQVKYLLNFISREHKRCCFHGVQSDLLKLQAELTGIPLIQKEVTADMKKYEEEFKQAVLELKAKGIKTMVFGDVYLLDQKNWVDRVCRDLGIKPVEPLWNISPEKIVEEFIEAGFKAIVVSAQASLLGKEFIGRYIDRDFVDEIKKKNICPCGENGEFHTLVVDGPMFKKRIEITEKEVIFQKGFWEYWFLDIKRYNVKEKESIAR